MRQEKAYSYTRFKEIILEAIARIASCIFEKTGGYKYKFQIVGNAVSSECRLTIYLSGSKLEVESSRIGTREWEGGSRSWCSPSVHGLNLIHHRPIGRLFSRMTTSTGNLRDAVAA